MAAKDPLMGFLPRHVKGSQVRKALVRPAFFLCLLSRVLILVAGGRRKSVHQAAAYATIQEDFGSAQEIAGVRADGRVLQDGECRHANLTREGASQNLRVPGTHARLEHR